MSKDDDQLDRLIVEYERLAEGHDRYADKLVAVAMRHGWNPALTGLVTHLRHQAEMNRSLAQEVRDHRP